MLNSVASRMLCRPYHGIQVDHLFCHRFCHRIYIFGDHTYINGKAVARFREEAVHKEVKSSKEWWFSENK